MKQQSQHIELTRLAPGDYEQVKQLMLDAYRSLSNPYWKQQQYLSLLQAFPEGQIAIRINGRITGCALSLIIDASQFKEDHSYWEITGNATFATHTYEGDTLYGIDVFVSREFRGLHLGRRMYDYRKDYCQRMNLKTITFGGRIPNYHKYSEQMSPQQYIRKVQSGEIDDPVFCFQISNGFQPIRIINGYMEGDRDSKEYAVLMRWRNRRYTTLDLDPCLGMKLKNCGIDSLRFNKV